VPRLEGLIEKAPNWRDLVRLTGGVAENAGDVSKAVVLYQRELDLAGENDPIRAGVVARINRLTQRIAATTLPPGAIPPAAAVPGSAAPRVAFPLNLLGVTSREMKAAPVVAVVGGVPPAGTLPSERFEVVADPATQSSVQTVSGGDDFMSEYMLTVVQAVQVVAPRARFLFAPLRQGGTTSADLVRAIKQVIDRRPEILLVTLGPLDGPVFESALQAAVNGGIVVVLAAGNDPGKPSPFAGTPLVTRMMVVAAADADGDEAKFTQKAKCSGS